VGTRIEDQPPEHWAGPESLDPTPVWKQFALIGIFLVLGLVLLGGVALFAAAPQLVTPPALVPGDRLVLRLDTVPAVGAGPKLIGQPVIDDARSFYLVQLAKGQVFAFRARWAERPGGEECRVVPAPGRPTPPPLEFLASDCAAASGQRGSPIFDLRGASTNGFRGLDQYLVSIGDDRVIVNLSRLIVSPERTSAPRTP
jgi:hypothetical protein